MRIGRVAAETGISKDAIRFYMKIGLLKDLQRSQGGYRLFGPESIRDLELIARARALGFSLAEIRELLLLQGQQGPACQQVRDFVQQKWARVRQRILELRQLEGDLARVWRKCSRELKRAREARPKTCPFLEELGRADGESGDLNAETQAFPRF